MTDATNAAGDFASAEEFSNIGTGAVPSPDRGRAAASSEANGFLSFGLAPELIRAV